MKTIAIEINNVLRNINQQILKYYQKDFNQELDLDECDEDKPWDYAIFKSKKEKNNFIYTDYPYELFGCAKTTGQNTARDLNNWLIELDEVEDEDYKVVLYSMDEESLTIQSSYFFLSKIGARVREVRFPLNFKEIKDIADILITYDAEKIKECKDKTTVYIGKGKCEEATYSYESFDEFLKNNFITKHKDDDGNE